MKKWVTGGVVVVAVGLVIAVANGSSSRTDSATNARNSAASLTIGSAAPDFTLPLSDKKTLALADMKDKKPVIVLATFAGCGASEGQALTQLQKEYGNKVQIVAVDILDGEPASALEKYNQDNNIAIPVAGYDKAMAQSYRLTRPDATFIINKQGIITYKDQGVTDYATYKQEVKKVL